MRKLLVKRIWCYVAFVACLLCQQLWVATTSARAWLVGAAAISSNAPPSGTWSTLPSSRSLFAGSANYCWLGGRPQLRLRGGIKEGLTLDGGITSAAAAGASPVLLDYTAHVLRVFDNMRLPAALLVGCILPLGFFASPREDKSDSAETRTLKYLHHILAAVAVGNLLTTVIWSTITVNRIQESPLPPAESVVAVLSGDLALPWFACNVHFLVGLLTFASSLGTYSIIQFGAERRPMACFLGGSLCLMVSIVNQQIRNGAGSALWMPNMPGLIIHYCVILVRHAFSRFNPLMHLSIVLFGMAGCWSVKLVRDTLRKE